MIRIVDFRIEYADAFKKLNYQWINKYFKVESSDQDMLENPQEYIIDNGGKILIALDKTKVIGTSALINMSIDGVYELAKMTVEEDYQGLGIGLEIGKASIEKAREIGAKRLFLETNSKLKPAIALYKKLGFNEVEGVDSPYERCDVQMELIF